MIINNKYVFDEYKKVRGGEIIVTLRRVMKKGVYHQAVFLWKWGGQKLTNTRREPVKPAKELI